MEYISFKSFPDKQAAEDFSEVLKQEKIPFVIEEDAYVFDPSYANNAWNKAYLVKIAPGDFKKANRAYENYFSGLLSHVESDYYLFSFSNDELKEIVEKPDEWGSLDYALAQKLLNERGVTLSDEHLENLRETRNQTLAEPEKEKPSNILAYYIISIIFFPVGLVIGWIWAYSKKTLPDGKRTYAYHPDTRKHGRIIFALACFLLVYISIVRILSGAFNLLPLMNIFIV
jgi:hypothetical protein